MGLTYRTSGPWGPGQGSNLSPVQVDDNFYYLIQQILQMESALSGGAVVSIESISMTGNQMTIVLTNGAHFVFSVPIGEFRPRGDWAPSTTYAVNDLVFANGNLYMVIYNHVSGTSFDPGANDGMGHSYYSLLIPGVSAQWPGVYVNTQASLTLALGHAGLYIRCTNPHGAYIDVPPNSLVPFQVATEIHFRQVGSGPIVFAALSGSAVVLNFPDGFQHQTDKNGSTVTIKKVDVDEWDIFGLLDPLGSPP